jgi:hypothetical protein
MKVKTLQSWYDISTQYTGTAENAFEIAKANNKSISDDPGVNDEIVIPSEIIKASRTIQYYEARKIEPATGLSISDLTIITKPDGIGFMKIGSTFLIR